MQIKVINTINALFLVYDPVLKLIDLSHNGLIVMKVLLSVSFLLLLNDVLFNGSKRLVVFDILSLSFIIARIASPLKLDNRTLSVILSIVFVARLSRLGVSLNVLRSTYHDFKNDHIEDFITGLSLALITLLIPLSFLHVNFLHDLNQCVIFISLITCIYIIVLSISIIHLEMTILVPLHQFVKQIEQSNDFEDVETSYHKSSLSSKVAAITSKVFQFDLSAEFDSIKETHFILSSLIESLFGSPSKQLGSAISDSFEGQQVHAVFGAVSLKHLSLLTRVLQEKVLSVINKVGEILEGVISEYHGRVIRSVHDSFLIIWKYPEQTNVVDIQKRIAELAMLAAAKVAVAISKCPVLASYRNHPKILQFESNFKIELNIGLHIGWAIEGIIGSEFKIDAAYISADVSNTHQICSLNEELGTNILCSEAYNLSLSNEMAEEWRLVDSVKLNSTKHNIKIYSLDMILSYSSDQRSFYSQPNIQRYRRLEMKLEPEYETHRTWLCDEDIQSSRDGLGKAFFNMFSMGFLNYEAGEWLQAASAFETTKEMCNRTDGPSDFLLRYMNRNPSAPAGWVGYRVKQT